MTYKEFKEIIEKSKEYKVFKNRWNYRIVDDKECAIVGYISAAKEKAINLNTVHTSKNFIQEYADVCWEFASTNLKERENE